MKIIKNFLFSFLTLTVMSAGNAAAQDYESQAAAGNEYTCYFLTSVDVLGTDVEFGEKGDIIFSKY